MPHPSPDLPAITEAHLRLLRIFRAVAEAGGLTAAETRLGMERSTISRHLQALEAKLGATLCHRGPAGFELTEFGRVALQVAIVAGETLDMVRDELDRARHAIRGDLHLGVADNCITNPNCHVHGALSAFRRQAPGATLHLSIGTPDDLRQGLVERRLHIAITGVVMGNATMRQQTLFPEQFKLYVGLPEGGAVPCLGDLARERYVLITRLNDYRTANLAKRLALERQAVARGLEAVAMLIAGGGYVGYLPTHFAEAMARQHPIHAVREADAQGYATRFAMTTMHNHRLPPAGELLGELLRQAHAA